MQIFRKPPPPPIAGWDITGDGVQNISGTGIFLDDASGTIQSYFYLKLYDENYPVKEGVVKLTAIGYKHICLPTLVQKHVFENTFSEGFLKGSCTSFESRISCIFG